MSASTKAPQPRALPSAPGWSACSATSHTHRRLRPINLVRESLAELLREAFIRELEPDLVHVFSVMEGYADSVVTALADWRWTIPLRRPFMI